MAQRIFMIKWNLKHEPSLAPRCCPRYIHHLWACMMATSNELKRPSELIQYEIECPRCYGIMGLCSDSETLAYACENCDFILLTTTTH